MTNIKFSDTFSTVQIPAALTLWKPKPTGFDAWYFHIAPYETIESSKQLQTPVCFIAKQWA